MLQNSARNITYEASSSSPNRQQQQQQPRLMNRMSDFLFQKRQGPLLHEDYQDSSSLSAHSGMVTSSTNGGIDGNGTFTNYSAVDNDNGSRADSKFSSTRSNLSNTLVNPNTSPPLCTVRLDGGIIHRQNGGGPPSPPQRRLPSQPTTNKDITPTATPTSNSESICPTSTTLSIEEAGFDQAFEKMAQEYGLPDNVAKTLSLEAKQVLLRNSQANSQQQHQQQTNNNNGFFSWRTWGIQKKQKQHMDVRRNAFFDTSTSSSTQPSSSVTASSTGPTDDLGGKKRGHNGNSIKNTRKKAHSTSARGKSQRASISHFNPDYNGNHHDSIKTHRYRRSLKKVLSPEYFIHLLKDTHVRDLDESQVQDLRVCLRSVKASWTTQFLQLDGYNVLSDHFRQMNQAPKRSPSDDKILQHLAKCFKAIMTHEQAGIAIVLTNPVGLEHIRDLLFGQIDQKQRALYSLSVITRAHFLNILCTLANLQTTQSHTVPYIHGYDVLRRLLLDRSGPVDNNNGNNDMVIPPSPDDTTTTNNNNNNSTFPFRMTLKEDPQMMMKIILEDDPFYISGQPWEPRYTSWMRELQYTVEKEIEPITFLAQVLDYKFESAFRQLRITPSTQQQDPATTLENSTLDTQKDLQEEEGTGSVMVDDGVVEYLIAHLRLINTVVSTQPTFCTIPYDDYGREKVRMEMMMSGFDKTSKALQCCPHPTLYAFYFRYLQPLLQPLVDITPRISEALPISNANTPLESHISTTNSSTQSPSNSGILRWEDEIRQAGGSSIVFEQAPWEEDDFYDDDDSDAYEDYDSNDSNYDGMDVDYDDDDDDDDLAITSAQNHDHRRKTNPTVTR